MHESRACACGAFDTPIPAAVSRVVPCLSALWCESGLVETSEWLPLFSLTGVIFIYFCTKCGRLSCSFIMFVFVRGPVRRAEWACVEAFARPQCCILRAKELCSNQTTIKSMEETLIAVRLRIDSPRAATFIRYFVTVGYLAYIAPSRCSTGKNEVHSNTR